MQVGLLRTPQFQRTVVKTYMGASKNHIRRISGETDHWAESGYKTRVVLDGQIRRPIVPFILPPEETFVKKFQTTKNLYPIPEISSRASEEPATGVIRPGNYSPTRRPLNPVSSTFCARPHLLTQYNTIWRDYDDKTLEERRYIFIQQLRSLLRYNALHSTHTPLDGFVRVDHILRHDPFFQTSKLGLFVHMIRVDKAENFELAFLPNLYNGKVVERLWVKERLDKYDKPFNSMRRVLQMSRLKTLIYTCHPNESSEIEQHGIAQGDRRFIRVYRTLESSLFKGPLMPVGLARRLCITIDTETAALLGVTFFTDNNNHVLAVGNGSGVIPREALINATLLETTACDLHTAEPECIAEASASTLSHGEQPSSPS